ncbi:MAG: nucleoside hydrolase [Kiritimatiellae bacterium]|nr:nucleoside hydrolase [Kiritimatiellia bacterium]
MNRAWFITLFAAAALTHAEPVRLIFDTDMGNDSDDLMALCMIHNLQSRGAVELLAVTITKDHPQAAAFTDAVNTFYGRPDIPIGVVKGGATPEPGKFNLLSEAKTEDGSLRYPHDLKSGNDAPEATGLLRKILAVQPDHSVTLVQVGFFTNFQRLLESSPDAHSPLNGKELIAKKVKLLSIMAGAFQTINWNNRYLEYNIVKDIPAAQKLAQEWPSPMTWSGYEIGIAATYPYDSIKRDYGYIKYHPMPEAYALYSPKGHNRPTWDPTALLYAVYPDRGYFSLSPAGNVTVADDGATVFRPGKDGQGRDRYLAMNAEQTARVREAIVQLCVAPPVK